MKKYLIGAGVGAAVVLMGHKFNCKFAHQLGTLQAGLEDAFSTEFGPSPTRPPRPKRESRRPSHLHVVK